MLFYKILSFMKKQWLGSAMAVLIIFFYFWSDQKTQVLLEKSEQLEKEVQKLEKTKTQSLSKIDSLSKLDKDIEYKIEYITKKGNDKILSIDTLTVDELQEYFTKEYQNR